MTIGIFSVQTTISLLFASATSVSVGAVLFRLSALTGLQTSVTLFQMVPLSLFLYSLDPEFLKVNNQNKVDSSKICMRHKLIAVFNGLFLRALDNVAFYQALSYLTSGEVLLISSFMSLITSVIVEYFLFKKKPRLATIIALTVGTVGLFLLIKPDLPFGHLSFPSKSRLLGIFWTVITGSACTVYYAVVRNLRGVSIHCHFLSNPIGCVMTGILFFGIANCFQFSSCSAVDRWFGVLSGLALAINGIVSISNVLKGRFLPSIVSLSRFWAIFLSFTLELILIPVELSLAKLVGGVILISALLIQMKSFRN